MANRDPQREIASQGKADDVIRTFGQEGAEMGDGLCRFLGQGPVEQLPVQMMAAAVVLQIEAKDVVSQAVEICARGEHVGRVGAALPTVDKNDLSPGRLKNLA